MLRGKKGVTLIELAVTLAIAGIVFLGLMWAFSFSSRINRNASELNTAQNLVKTKMEVLESSLRYADQCIIFDEVPADLTDGLLYIYNQNGTILTAADGTDPSPISPDRGFEAYSYILYFSPANEKVLRISLAMWKGEEQIYSITSDIFLNNLPSAGITGSQQGSCAAYAIP